MTLKKEPSPCVKSERLLSNVNQQVEYTRDMNLARVDRYSPKLCMDQVYEAVECLLYYRAKRLVKRWMYMLGQTGVSNPGGLLLAR